MQIMLSCVKGQASFTLHPLGFLAQTEQHKLNNPKQIDPMTMFRMNNLKCQQCLEF